MAGSTIYGAGVRFCGNFRCGEGVSVGVCECSEGGQKRRIVLARTAMSVHMLVHAWVGDCAWLGARFLVLECENRPRLAISVWLFTVVLG